MTINLGAHLERISSLLFSLSLILSLILSLSLSSTYRQQLYLREGDHLH